MVRSVVCHHAENGYIHRKIAVGCAPMIKSIGETLFQTRLDQEKGLIGPTRLLHS